MKTPVGVDTIILGCGLSGITLAHHLNRLGISFVLLEKNDQPGGLCRTFITGDYHWDLGVHAIYGKNSNSLDFFVNSGVEFGHHDRNVKILQNLRRGYRLIEYPFENGVRDLSFPQMLNCVCGYLSCYLRQHSFLKRDITNFQEWIDYILGRGTKKYFMDPYNHKIWSCPLDQISLDLVNQKIDPAPIMEYIKGVFWKRQVGRSYQAKFIYPTFGVGDLMKVLAAQYIKEDQLFTGVHISQIRKKKGLWTVVTQCRQFEARNIISTIPVPELLRLLGEDSFPGTGVEGLEHNNTLFVMIGLKPGRKFRYVDDLHWFFFPGREAFYRGTCMHAFSPRFPRCMVLEVTVNHGHRVLSQYSDLAQRTIEDLIKYGLVNSEHDISMTDFLVEPYTYPIPTLGKAKIIENLENRLKVEGVRLFGRNGRWNYINMDGIVKEAQEFVGTFK